MSRLQARDVGALPGRRARAIRQSRPFAIKTKYGTYYCAQDVSPARLRLLSLIGVGAVLVLLVVLAVLARLDIKPAPTASAEVPALLAVGTELQKPRPVSSMPLIDAHGKPFSLTQWRGKWVILAPSMTLCHEVCPMTTGALMELSTTCASPACPSGWSSPRRPSIRGATARSGCARIRS